MKPDLPYRSRSQAGRLLAGALSHYKSKEDVVVLGLTRGGVPVAGEIASRLGVPLDVLVVRKLGVPFQPELAMGAIAADGTRVLNEQLIRDLRISANDVDTVVRREQAELERRERLYRGGRPPIGLNGRIVILADDGLATGSTMRAAICSTKKQSAKRIVLAVPVASVSALERLRTEVDECVCLAAPEPFFAVGEWYGNFPQITDAEVMKLLEDSRQRIDRTVPQQAWSGRKTLSGG